MKEIHQSLIFRYRGLIGIVCLLPVAVAVVFSSPSIQEDTPLDFFMEALGWICFLLYGTLRIWATMYIGKRKDRELQQQGPYSITRNPLYLGSFCFALATALFFKSFTLLAATAFIAVVYLVWIIPAEEKFLHKTFGALFRQYLRKTPRFFSSIRNYYASSSVEVNVKAMKLEAKRLWLAGLWPFLAEILMHLRGAGWWPCLFNLP